MLKRLVIGQALSSFPGGTINKLIDDYNARQSAPPTPPPTQKTATQPPPSVIALLVWEGAETPMEGTQAILPPGASVILGAPVTLPEDDDTVPFMGLRLYCDKATEETKDKPYAILQSPFLVPAQGTKAVAYGYIPNACWAQVTINAEEDETAELVADETYLSSTTSGRVPIIWKPTGTGLKWCVVQLQAGGSGGDIAWHAKVTEEITAGDLIDNYGWGKVVFASFDDPADGIDDEPSEPQTKFSWGEVEHIVYNMTSFTAPVDSQIQCKVLGPDGKLFWDVKACEGE